MIREHVAPPEHCRVAKSRAKIGNRELISQRNVYFPVHSVAKHTCGSQSSNSSNITIYIILVLGECC